MKTEFCPIQVPNFVLLKLPGDPKECERGPAIAITRLDADQLDFLANEFRAGLFKKSGLSDPYLPQQGKKGKTS